MKLKRFILKFCERILGAHYKKTANLAIRAELVEVPLIVQISSFVVKYWIRINNKARF